MDYVAIHTETYESILKKLPRFTCGLSQLLDVSRAIKLENGVRYTTDGKTKRSRGIPKQFFTSKQLAYLKNEAPNTDSDTGALTNLAITLTYN